MKIIKSVLFLLFIFPIVCFSQDKIEHEVKQKETLYGISKLYNISIEEIKSLNNFIETDGLQPAQILLIKKGKEKKNTSTKFVNSKIKYKYVTIEPKQTLYSLTKKYNLSEEELMKLNPSIKSGLKIGDSIKILDNQNTNKQIKNDLKGHLVKNKETIYSITKKYNLTEKELYELNPQLKSDGLQPDTYLLVSTKTEAKQQNIKLIDKSLLQDIHVVMMLPFDAVENKDALRKITGDFLIGSKLAIDSLAKQGKKIHLKVFDTKNDEQEIKNFLSLYDFSTVDVVIGPMFKSQIELVANTIDKKIPIVSPISTSESLLEYPNLVIAEPTLENVADKILEEVNKEFSDEKIFILTTEKEQEIAEYTKNKFLENHPKSSVEIIYDIAGFPSGDNLVSLVEKEKAFIAILASKDNSLGESYINYLYNDLYEKDIKNVLSYGIGYIPVYDKNFAILKSIEFTYSLTHRVNVYGIEEKELIKKFKKTCCQEASEHMKIGYDIIYDIIDRMNKKGDLWNKLTGAYTRFYTKFDYVKVKNAYVNQGVRLIKFHDSKIEKPSL